MNHFLIIRFNLKWKEGVEITESWCKERLNLFRRFCLPSIVGQRDQNFRFFILLCTTSFPWIITEFKRIKVLHSKVEPILIKPIVNKETGLERQLQEYFSNHIVFSYPLVTTRMDSDDIIAEDFIKGINDVVGSKTEFLTYPNGYIFQNNMIRKHKRSSGGFMTLVNNTDGVETVYYRNHLTVRHAAPRRFISSKRAWCYMRHPSTYACITRGRMPNYPYGNDSKWQTISQAEVRFEIKKFIPELDNVPT